MTARKELIKKVKDALATISLLELVDLDRNQFNAPKENYPSLFTAGLIKVENIRWENMVEQKQEGTATIKIAFYGLDGFMDQLAGTSDDEDGLIDIDILDLIVEKIEGLKGDYFRPLQLSDERDLELDTVQMSYELSFTTKIYRRVNGKYQNRSLTLTPN